MRALPFIRSSEILSPSSFLRRALQLLVKHPTWVTTEVQFLGVGLLPLVLAPWGRAFDSNHLHALTLLKAQLT
jgi:hypothetical protein